MKLYALHLDAGTTTMGNPRRAYVFWDENGHVHHTSPEGFDGRGPIKDARKEHDVIELGTVTTTASEYREWLKIEGTHKETAQ